MKRLVRSLGFVAAALAAACGSSSPAPPSSTSTSTVTGVAVSPSVNELAAGYGATLTAAVSGTGAFSDSVSWDIDSGPGTLSGTSGPFVTYRAPASVTEETSVVVRASSVQDSARSGTVTLGVAAAAECTSAAQAGACGADHALPDICMLCSNGQTACAHFICAGGMCAVQICP